MKPKVVAYDLGLTTGWARILDGRLVYGTLRLKGDRFEGGGMPAVRFRTHLAEMSEGDLRPDLVVFEKVHRHDGTAAAHWYGGLFQALASYLETRDVPYAGIDVADIKRHATGKGNASKLMVQAAALDLLQKRDCLVDPPTEDEADAIVMLDFAIARYGKALS